MNPRSCPRCGSPLMRVHRRSVDRVLSVIWKVERYRCYNFQCQWEGNLRPKEVEH